MMRFVAGLLLLLSLASCRKDLLPFHAATRLTTGVSNRLNRILFVNDSLGFVCGGSRFDEADILITRDGGRTWTPYISPDAHKELFGMTQAPDGSIWCIGFDGNLLRTRDEGLSWLRFQLRYDAYKALAFAGPNEIQAVGGVSFELGDATVVDTIGRVLSHDSLGYELNDIVLLPDGKGWRCGYGVMQYTDDAGKSWQWQSPNNDNFTALDVHSDQVAYACGGEGSIYATADGGKNWQCLRNGNDLRYPKYRLRDLLFLDPKHGYAVGEKGVVIYTDDGGRHWSRFEKFTDEHLFGIAANSRSELFICGDGGALWKLTP